MQVLYICKKADEIESILPSSIDAYDNLCEVLLNEWATEAATAGAIFEMRDINAEFEKYIEQLDTSYEKYTNGTAAWFGYGKYRVTKYKEEE